MKRILCYGDSNTWGYTPGTAVRFDEETRWTGVLAKALGPKYRILEESLGGRTTAYDDPQNPWMNAKRSLGYVLLSQKPLDLVVLCLGTNDLKFTDVYGAARGVSHLIDLLKNADAVIGGSSPTYRGEPKILLISPIHIHADIDRCYPPSTVSGKWRDSQQFAREFKRVAEEKQVFFLDAALYGEPSPIDCVHMDAQSHQRLGLAVAEQIRAILEE